MSDLGVVCAIDRAVSQADDHGDKCRRWVGLAVADPDMLRVLVADHAMLADWYEPQSFLRDRDMVEAAISQLEAAQLVHPSEDAAASLAGPPRAEVPLLPTEGEVDGAALLRQVAGQPEYLDPHAEAHFLLNDVAAEHRGHRRKKKKKNRGQNELADDKSTQKAEVGECDPAAANHGSEVPDAVEGDASVLPVRQGDVDRDAIVARLLERVERQRSGEAESAEPDFRDPAAEEDSPLTVEPTWADLPSTAPNGGGAAVPTWVDDSAAAAGTDEGLGDPSGKGASADAEDAEEGPCDPPVSPELGAFCDSPGAEGELDTDETDPGSAPAQVGADDHSDEERRGEEVLDGYFDIVVGSSMDHVKEVPLPMAGLSVGVLPLELPQDATQHRFAVSIEERGDEGGEVLVVVRIDAPSGWTHRLRLRAQKALPYSLVHVGPSAGNKVIVSLPASAGMVNVGCRPFNTACPPGEAGAVFQTALRKGKLVVRRIDDRTLGWQQDLVLVAPNPLVPSLERHHLVVGALPSGGPNKEATFGAINFELPDAGWDVGLVPLNEDFAAGSDGFCVSMRGRLVQVRKGNCSPTERKAKKRGWKHQLTLLAWRRLRGPVIRIPRSSQASVTVRLPASVNVGCRPSNAPTANVGRTCSLRIGVDAELGVLIAANTRKKMGWSGIHLYQPVDAPRYAPALRTPDEGAAAALKEWHVAEDPVHGVVLEGMVLRVLHDGTARSPHSSVADILGAGAGVVDAVRARGQEMASSVGRLVASVTVSGGAGGAAGSDSDDGFELLDEADEGDGVMGLNFDSNALLAMVGQVLELQQPRQFGEPPLGPVCPGPEHGGHGCGRLIPVVDEENPTQYARRCAYDGLWYCHRCHTGELATVPAMLIKLGETRPQFVSRRARQFLELVRDEPLFHTSMLAPDAAASDAGRELLALVLRALRETTAMRGALCALKAEVMACPLANFLALRKRLWPKEHMWESVDKWSLDDLVSVAAWAGGGAVHRRSTAWKIKNTIKLLVMDLQKHVTSCSRCKRGAGRR